MRVSTSDSATDWLVTAPLKTADVESFKTVAVLEELLAQSIHLRDLYKHARWQTSDIQYLRVRQLFQRLAEAEAGSLKPTLPILQSI